MEGGGKEQVAIKLDGVPSRFEESPSRSIAPNFCNFRLMANIRIVTKKEALKRLLVLAINDEISFPPRFSSFVCSLFRTERLEVEVYEV